MERKALFCVMALAAAPAFADDTGHWYVTPQAGRLWSDNDRGIEDHDWLFGLGIGKHLSERWSLELNANTAQLDAPGADVDFNAVSLDLLRVFARDRAVSPYITFGMGSLETDVSPGDSTTDFMVQAGVGLMWRLWQNDSGTRTFSLRPEVKARRDDVGREGHETDYLAQLGFQFSFGAPRAAPPPPPVAAAPAPAPAPTAAPPALPPPPADSDGDGVLDPADRCPGTARGVAVDASGCPRKGSITLEGVAFEVNSAQLTAESRPVLARVATDLVKYPSLRIEVQGHTDSSGADQYNLKLSERRAQAVRDYLVSQGVPAQQVAARGYGETQPIADNGSADGRARNRRVVMDVLENPGEVEVEGEKKL